MADGSRRYLAYIKEVTAGTTPSTPTMKALRVTGGDSLNNSRSNVTSDEIRSDRQIIVSRLGQNAPELSVPIELSFESYDDLLAGALGNSWVGGYNLTVSVDFSGATITHASGTYWNTLGVAIGDYVVLSNLVTTAEDGAYYISNVNNAVLTLTETDGTTPASFTTQSADEITMIGGFTGGQINTATNNITVSATAYTYTAASSAGWNTTYHLTEGDAIFFAGFSNASNNGWKTISSISDTVITVAETTLTAETLSTGDMDFATSSALLTTGISIPTFTIEEGFEDVSEYHNMKGAKINNFALSMTPDSIITGSFDFVGQKYSPFSDHWTTPDTPGTGESIATSVTAANTNSVFDSYTGSFIFDGENIGSGSSDIIITSLDFTLANDVNRRYGLLDRDAKSLSQGRITCSGSISAYFADATLSTKFDNETEFEMRIRLEDLSGNSYLFGWPKTKFTTDSKTVSETDVTQSMDVMMLGGDTYFNTMYIKKQPVAS